LRKRPRNDSRRHPDAFRHAILEAADASLLAFAGQHRDVATILEEDEGDRYATEVAGNAELERAETPVGDVAFYTTRLPLGEARLIVNAGAAADVLDAVGDRDRVRAARAALEQRLAAARVGAREPVDSGVESWVNANADGREIEGVQPTGSYFRLALE
jgi:hypothetical protein